MLPRMVIHWLTYFFLRIVICVMQSMRIETCDSFCRFLAWFSHRVIKVRRQVIDENISFAFPELDGCQREQMAVGMWHHIFLLMCELVHVPRKLHETNWHQHVYISSEDCNRHVALMLDDRPLVVVSGHFGNFEVGGVISGLLGFPTYTVARPLDNPFLHRFFTKFREATGQFMLPKIGSARQIDAILSSGGTMVLLGDQSAGPKGCWIDFFGRPASAHKAVALFSLMNNAPMAVAYAKRNGAPMKFKLGLTAVFDPKDDEPMGTKELTQWYSQQLEAEIRTAPEQYWWLHRRWKYKPPTKSSSSRIDSGESSSPAAHQKKTDHVLPKRQ